MATEKLIIESPTHGTFTVLYDSEDKDKVLAHTWRVSPRKNESFFYVMTHVRKPNGKPSGLYLHRLLTNAKKGEVVDHINGNRLDNRKENLNVGTSRRNNQNKGKQKNNTSGYKGVCYIKKSKDMAGEHSKPWYAQLQHKRKHVYIGRFATKEEAARAYDAKARELWDIVNPEKQLNFPDEK